MYSWQIRMLSQSPEVTRFDLSCLKIILSAGSILSATIRMEAMERIPTLRFEICDLSENAYYCLLTVR